MQHIAAILLPGLACVQGARRAQQPINVLNDRSDAQDFIVLFREGTKEAAIKAWCGGACSLTGHPDQGGLAFAGVKGRESLDKLLSKRSTVVDLVEVDEQDREIPDVVDEVVTSAASWGLEEVGVAERGSTGKGVHIYVQDTGVRTSHRDFGGRAVPYLDMTSGNVVECAASDSSCSRDGQGHGTHCAGTAAGNTYGVASDAFVYGTKTLSDSGTGQRAWNIAGIDWVVAKGGKPAVVSLSLGGEGQDQGYLAAIETATAQGVTVVVAAGNFGSDSCTYSPAFVPSAITVGATQAGGRRAAYSNFGSCNDIMAPGSQVTSASHLADNMNTRMTGTSMACPHVSGAAALLLETNPSWTRDRIMAHLDSFGRKGYVSDLRGEDPDLFLWVGKEPAPGPPECPGFAVSSDPNFWGDCDCPRGKFCSRDGSTRNCPSAWGVGGSTGREFNFQCRDCQCY
jgi:subtilisin family serine protease